MKIKKQVVIGILVTLGSLLMISNFSMAQTATVNTDTLKLRKEASTDSTVLELLNQGQKLEVLEQAGDWAKVKVNKMTGYVHMDYIKLQEETNKTNTQNTANEVVQTGNNEIENTIVENVVAPQETSQTPERQETTYQMKEETLKSDAEVRILPLINATKIDTLKKDAKVIVVDQVTGWLYIQTEEITGWIRKSALEEKESNSAEPQPQEGETAPVVEPKQPEEEQEKPSNEETPIDEKAMYVNSPSIYVRKGPSTSEEVVDSLILNAQVMVIAEVEDWYKVKVDNKTGYIAKRLLSNSKQETTSRGAEERTNEPEELQAAPVASSKGEEIANFAKQYLGCKYVYGGSGPSTFDCSGFTMYVYKQFGINLSHSARAQAKNGSYVAKGDLQPGDLVFFKDYETMDGIGHCGIYVGEGNFIHASSGTGYCVKISTLLSGSYQTRYETARRLI